MPQATMWSLPVRAPSHVEQDCGKVSEAGPKAISEPVVGDPQATAKQDLEGLMMSLDPSAGVLSSSGTLKHGNQAGVDPSGVMPEESSFGGNPLGPLRKSWRGPL